MSVIHIKKLEVFKRKAFWQKYKLTEVFAFGEWRLTKELSKTQMENAIEDIDGKRGKIRGHDNGSHCDPQDCISAVTNLNKAGFTIICRKKVEDPDIYGCISGRAFLTIQDEVIDTNRLSKYQNSSTLDWDCASKCVEYEEKLLAGKYDKKIKKIGKNAQKRLIKLNNKLDNEIIRFKNVQTQAFANMVRIEREINNIMNSYIPRKQDTVKKLTSEKNKFQEVYENTGRINQIEEKIMVYQNLLNHSLIKLYLNEKSPNKVIKKEIFAFANGKQPAVNEMPKETKLTTVSADIASQNNQTVKTELPKKSTLSIGQIDLISDIVKQAVDKEINARR